MDPSPPRSGGESCGNGTVVCFFLLLLKKIFKLCESWDTWRDYGLEGVGHSGKIMITFKFRGNGVKW